MRAAVAVVLLLSAPLLLAKERILEFHSDIRVFPDATIEVTETIVVTVEGVAIRRGIYRDFPVEYRDSFGNTVEVDVEPLSVLRNGQPETFHTVRSGRDIRTYFGHKDVFLEYGTHTYQFRYRASRMLGFFEEHDEIYWNVTGFRWVFPIEAASATVRLEFDAPQDRRIVDAYTGPFGATNQDYERNLDEGGNVHFKSSKRLGPTNGLTIVVGWPKGYVTEPGRWQKTGWLLSDNRNVLVAVIGWLLLILYYIPMWLKHGKNPDLGPVVTRYEPPENYSPASLRYIDKMRYDDTVMTAAVVNLAVKGYLTISNSDGTHRLTKTSGTGNAPLAAGEAALLGVLFEGKHSNISLSETNHSVLGRARTAHRDSLRADYKQKYFRTNGVLNIVPSVIAIGTMVIALGIGTDVTKLLIAVLAGIYLTLIFFALIMPKPTERGQKVLDQLEGFKDYLTVAEEDELNLRSPPEKTPALFEKMLPYALALGIDQKWAKRFASILAAATQSGGETYRPGWYQGDWSNADLSQTTHAMSSDLNSAISSSVSPPGSSSGSSGGSFSSGSSGGGGGGGGGGGW